MEHTLVFQTGKTTCSQDPPGPGRMCQWVRTKSFGSKFVCRLFDDARLYDKDGWLQRRPECLAEFPDGAA